MDSYTRKSVQYHAVSPLSSGRSRYAHARSRPRRHTLVLYVQHAHTDLTHAWVNIDAIMDTAMVGVYVPEP